MCQKTIYKPYFYTKIGQGLDFDSLFWKGKCHHTPRPKQPLLFKKHLLLGWESDRLGMGCYCFRGQMKSTRGAWPEKW